MTSTWKQALAYASGLTGGHDRYARLRSSTSSRDYFRSAGIRYIEPGLWREVMEVDPSLMAQFRRLVCGEDPWPLYLHGPVGVGKTLAALCLCDMVYHATYWTTDELAEGEQNKGTRSVPWDEYRWPIQPELMVLDELGMRDASDGWKWSLDQQVVKKFIDWRERNCGGVAVYISNHPLETMKSLYDARVMSRLGCGTVFELAGVDRRLEGNE